MRDLKTADSPLLDVRVRLGRERLYTASPARVQVLVETRPSPVTRAPHEPVELRLVIDVSGSMASPGDREGNSKLALVKRAALELLEKLEGRDRMLVSVFSTQGELIIPATRLDESGASSRIAAAIAGLLPMTGTNIHSGLWLALSGAYGDTLTRVLLFTDGESSDPQTDHPALVRLADEAREKDIPLSIYGTGASYNWSLLRQLAARAGGGSFCQHVLSTDELSGHLLSELAMLRGTAVDHLVLQGQVEPGARIVSVHTCLPVIKELTVDDGHFEDRAGALDVHRAARHLIELDIDQPQPGDRSVLTLTLRGRRLSTLMTHEVQIPVSQTFVGDVSQQSPVSEDVRQVMLAILANQRAEQGDYTAAEDLFRRAGDHATADSMATMAGLSQGAAFTAEEVRRSAATRTSMSMAGTLDPIPRRK